MYTRDFQYDLPDELIARVPAARRTDSRLLHLAGGDISPSIAHYQFSDLPSLLNAGDLLVFNDTRVINARLFGHKSSGGRVEILVERITGSFTALVQIRASKSPGSGTRIFLDASPDLISSNAPAVVEVEGREGQFFVIRSEQELLPLLDQLGHVPLPPYIDRADEIADQERYQTVYNKHAGAVAAPTAGLHFDELLLETLATMGVSTAYLTLHVGAGTFQPIRAERITDHQMHSEWIDVGADVINAVQACRVRGGRVIAVGTTSVRSLETAANSGELAPYSGDTDIFIYPGYEFRVVDGMITNFHLPGSSLIMLVSAFTGVDTILQAYKEAIAERYRFFSYGDAMLITR